jgi:3-oxoacyl-[acyl-carrier-protein] synthase II
MLKQKVYILDYEMVSPIALGVHKLIDNLKANTCADRPITRFDTAGLPFKNAAEVLGDLEELNKDESELIKTTLKSERMLELLAATFNLSKNRLHPLINLFEQHKTGVIIGVGADVTPFELFEDKIVEFLNNDVDANAIVELFTEINTNNTKVNAVVNPYDLYAIYLANKFNAGAFQKSVLTACTSSTQAIAFGYDSVNKGEAEVVIAGGTDSIVNTLATISFGKLGVISETAENSKCRPFDKNRNGTLSAEAAGFVILASESFVKKHKLKPKAQILGYGNTLDAFKITAPNPDGISMTKAIKDAVINSGISPEDIDYINAHGTGTKHNDELELKSLVGALGEVAKSIPISSTKSRHGHAIGAAGIQEVCLILEAMKHSFLPANLNLNTPCKTDMNLITKNQDKPINIALTNNFAFGGVNTVLVIKNELNN